MNDEGQMTNYSHDAPKEDDHLGEAKFWGHDEHSEVSEFHEEPSGKPVYDLEERTAQFGEAIIRFAKKIARNPVNEPLISQLVSAGTSVGANYCEADDAVSRKEFKQKIRISFVIRHSSFVIFQPSIQS